MIKLASVASLEVVPSHIQSAATVASLTAEKLSEQYKKYKLFIGRS